MTYSRKALSRLIRASNDMLRISLHGLCSYHFFRFISCILLFLPSDSVDHGYREFIARFCEHWTLNIVNFFFSEAKSMLYLLGLCCCGILWILDTKLLFHHGILEVLDLYSLPCAEILGILGLFCFGVGSWLEIVDSD